MTKNGHILRKKILKKELKNVKLQIKKILQIFVKLTKKF
jgi:hypothetical protein